MKKMFLFCCFTAVILTGCGSTGEVVVVDKPVYVRGDSEQQNTEARAIEATFYIADFGVKKDARSLDERTLSDAVVGRIANGKIQLFLPKDMTGKTAPASEHGHYDVTEGLELAYVLFYPPLMLVDTAHGASYYMVYANKKGSYSSREGQTTLARGWNLTSNGRVLRHSDKLYDQGFKWVSMPAPKNRD
jgi:hypothetical protein